MTHPTENIWTQASPAAPPPSPAPRRPGWKIPVSIAAGVVALMVVVSWISQAPSGPSSVRMANAEGGYTDCASRSDAISTFENSSYALANQVRIVEVIERRPLSGTCYMDLITNAGRLTFSHKLREVNGRVFVDGQIRPAIQ